MAPMVPILDKDDVSEMLKKHGVTRLEDCPLKQLVQFECELKLADNKTKYECVPFKRLFRECANLRVEVTDSDTNSSI